MIFFVDMLKYTIILNWRVFILKKILLIILAAITAFSFTGCMSQDTVTYSPVAPYWQKDTAAAPSSTFNETCLYTAEYVPLEGGNSTVGIELDSDSYYKTTLTTATYKEEVCNLLTVETKMKGRYTLKTEGEQVEYFEFDDLSVSKTYFIWKGAIKVKYTEEEMQSTLPVNAAASEDEFGNKFIKLSCKITTEYGDEDAVTSFAITGDKEKTSHYFAISDGITFEIKKYASTNYVDRNMLAFALRTFDFATDLTYSFSTVDVLANKKHSMKYTAKEQTTAEEIKNVAVNGIGLGRKVESENGAFTDGTTNYDTILSTETYTMQIAVNETYGGSPMTCKYVSNKEYYHYMYSLETVIPYSMGIYKYTLKSVDRQD